MIKEGQIYREKNPPYFRHDEGNFAVTHQLFTNCDIVYQNGQTARVSLDWIKGDCVLVKEFDTWQEAITKLTRI